MIPFTYVYQLFQLSIALPPSYTLGWFLASLNPHDLQYYLYTSQGGLLLLMNETQSETEPLLQMIDHS